MGKMNMDPKLDKHEQSLAETDAAVQQRTQVLMNAANTREQFGPTVYATLYKPKLEAVVKQSSVAHAVNPILSTPSSEVKSHVVSPSEVKSDVVSPSDYKGTMFKDREDVMTPSTTAPQDEEHRSPGFGGSSNSGG